MATYLLCLLDVIFNRPTVGILMGNNCVPLLAYFFLYSLVAEFMVRLLKIEKDEMSRSTINLSIATIEGSSEKRSHKTGSR